jgi:D-beta-D-heptose 7-phosphate kinase/D-beta-D-heptose 1-phosphate adenosyltransferase
LRILLVGDSCYDIYHYGEVKRISPEAPIPIFDLKYSEKKHGMASNVYENLKALGAEVHIHTSFKEKKNRYIDLKSKQQLLRVDEKIDELSFNSIMYGAINYEYYDAIVISDYGKGFFKYSDYQILRENFDGPIFLDTKDRNLDLYEGAIVKVNQYEYDVSDLGTELDDLIITYGGEKVTWRDKTFYPPKVHAYDVCGAGDTFLAALAVRYVETNNMEEAIEFAMKAAAITVRHIGVYAPTRKEIED